MPSLHYASPFVLWTIDPSDSTTDTSALPNALRGEFTPITDFAKTDPFEVFAFTTSGNFVSTTLSIALPTTLSFDGYGFTLGLTDSFSWYADVSFRILFLPPSPPVKVQHYTIYVLLTWWWMLSIGTADLQWYSELYSVGKVTTSDSFESFPR